MKALEKDRTRRYGSPNELSADIVRHLNDEPVLAGPPSTVYRTAKFVRRHRLGVAVAAAALLALVGFAGRERIQASRIAREAQAAEQVSAFLVRLFEVSNPSEARGNSITAREILDKGAKQIEQELVDQPLLQARLRSTMGMVYRRLGLLEQARPFLEQALAKRRNLLGEDHRDTLASMKDLGNLYRDQGRFDEAEPLSRTTLETQRRVLGEDHANTLAAMNDLANLYKNQGRYGEAEPLYRKALEAQRRVLGDNHSSTLTSAHNLANVYRERGRYDQAESLYLKIIETMRRVLGEDHPDAPLTMNNLAILYQDQRRYDEARQLLERAIAITEKARGTEDARYPIYIHTLGELLLETEKLEHADRELRRAIGIYESRGHRFLGLALYQLAGVSARQDHLELALGFLRQALEKGWADKSIFDDANLKSLRGRPEFEAIVSEVKSRIAKRSKG